LKNLAQLFRAVEHIAQTERTIKKQLDQVEEEAAAAEKNAAPELGRILLIHADLLRGILEGSRNFWKRLTLALGVALIICLVLLALLAFNGR